MDALPPEYFGEDVLYPTATGTIAYDDPGVFRAFTTQERSFVLQFVGC